MADFQNWRGDVQNEVMIYAAATGIRIRDDNLVCTLCSHASEPILPTFAFRQTRSFNHYVAPCYLVIAVGGSTMLCPSLEDLRG
jgi:hypothetical protein